MTKKNTKNLSSKIRRGDTSSFELIYRRHHQQLFYLAQRYLKDQGLAEDAVQDVFVKLWAKRKQLDPGRPVKGYLFTMLKNHVLNMIRDRKREVLSAYTETIDTEVERCQTEDAVIYDQYKHIMQQGLQRLSARKKQVFELKTFKGLSNAQVAEELLISVNTVKTHFYHGSRFLRNYLEKHANISSIFLLISFFHCISV